MIAVLKYGIPLALIICHTTAFPTLQHSGRITRPGPIIMDERDIPGREVSDPVKVPWTTLMFIKYEEKYFEETKMEMLAPVFTEEIKKLDGKQVEVEGFVIPLDDEGKFIALSANPYASCFFCGQASPASVISIYLKDQKRNYKIDEYLHFEGFLKLNYGDPLEFYYILEDAREMKKY